MLMIFHDYVCIKHFPRSIFPGAEISIEAFKWGLAADFMLALILASLRTFLVSLRTYGVLHPYSRLMQSRSCRFSVLVLGHAVGAPKNP